MLKVPFLLQALGVDYKPRGPELWARCPLPGHDDADPSFQIRDEPGSQSHGLWRCFGCGARGNAVQLAMAVLDVDRRSAKHWMELNGISSDPPVPVDVRVEARPEHASFSMPDGVKFEAMANWPMHVLRYMARVTSLAGLEPWQVARWGIGYATMGKLAGRVVVPVVNERMITCGYTARTIVGDEKRYLEDRSELGVDVVFGEQHWPSDHEEREVLVLCEGAMNALAIERVLKDFSAEVGGRNVSIGAVRGIDLNPTRAGKVATFSEVVVASDPDAAGEKLHRRVVASCGRWCGRITRAWFPEGEDAASMHPSDLVEVLVGAYAPAGLERVEDGCVVVSIVT